jgi:GNAT superfamily N-acetyltransferase
MSSLSFRRAASGDLEAIVGLLAADPIGSARESVGTPLDPCYRAAFDAIERDPNQLLAVADRNGQVIGVVQLSFIPGLARRGMWRGQIEGVRIAGSERGTGIGRAMLMWAVEECKKRGCGLVQLTSDKRRPDAHRFYQALGFQATHEGYKLVL